MTHTSTSNISCITQDLILGTTDGYIEIPDTIRFKSHHSSFDYLESVDISEKITCISQMNLGNGYLNLLTSNEKQIKLYSINNSKTPIPLLDIKDSHQYSINDIAQLPGTHNFLSIDYLQLKMNNVDLSSYTMINIKPESIDNLKWLFTCLCVRDSHTFLYGTSNGNTCLNDIRLSPYSQTVSKTCEKIDELYRFISDIKVEDNYLYIRNMTGVSIYDLRNSDLVKSYELLSERTKRMLYHRSDCCDRIQMCVENGKIVTGSYENKCYVINEDVSEIEIENDKMVQNCVWHEGEVVVANNNELYFYK